MSGSFRYRGYFFDSDTFMYFLKTRWYDPTLRRFLSPDSLFVAGNELTGVNLYAYCNGDPVNYSDPDGCKTIKTTGLYNLLESSTLAAYQDDQWGLRVAAMTSTIALAQKLGLGIVNSLGLTNLKLYQGSNYSYLTGTSNFQVKGYNWNLDFVVASIGSMRSFIDARKKASKERDTVLDMTVYNLSSTSNRRIENSKGQPLLLDVIIATAGGLTALGTLIADSVNIASTMAVAISSLIDAGVYFNDNFFLFIPTGNLKGKKIK
ncbi:MAG: RHS repeat-associated core domain-containing protein [Oscillospiraceae bacterium]|nr:RHS repeat-associated core domain-containing protein [Oscillospiraceae bacterium]